MKRRSFLKTAGASGLLVLVNPTGIVQVLAKSTETDLTDGFTNPPLSARPHTYWFWMNGNVTADGITRDLEAMKKIGLAGFLNFNCGVAIPKGPIVYLSPEWISLVEHTVKEADRLGLEFGMHNSPGWSSSGGPWITPEMSMQKVVWTEAVVKGGERVKTKLAKPAAKLNYYKDTYVIAFPSSTEEIKSFTSGQKAAGPDPHSRLQDWEEKAGYDRSPETRMMERAPFAGSKPRKPVAHKVSVPYEVPKESIIPSGAVIDISRYMSPNGELEWEAPSGFWTILRFGHTPTGAENRAAPDTGQGLECDKLSREAFDMHFNSMFEHLLPFMKGPAAKGGVAIEIDSYEVGMQNWTKKFPEAFKNSRGYEIKNYLPAMTGRVIGSTAETEAFLWDLRRVIADMMAENYYGRCAELCKQNNFVFYGEPYKLGPFDSLQAGSRIEIAMGEFWSRGQRNKHAVKLASSIQHINGKKIVAAESFTGHAINSKWQQFPFSLKAQGDYMFTKGINRMVFHVYAHQVHPTVRPGMTMGQFGTHFDRNNTWFDQGTAWVDYLSRCQFMLQQGNYVADLLYYTGDDAPGEDLGTKESPMPPPPVGYEYDYLNTEVLKNRIRIENKQIVFPEKMNYRLLIMPLHSRMTLATLTKIRDLVKEGMCILGPKPEVAAGISDQNTAEFEKLTSEIWGNLNGKDKQSGSFGLGKVFWGTSVKIVLDAIGVEPDFSFSSRTSDPAINYIHRRQNGIEIYFINNRRRRKEDLVASFRVKGKKPEFWDAVTGERRPVSVYSSSKGRINIPLQLEEAGSIFVIFREADTGNHILSITKGNKKVLGLSPFPEQMPVRYKNLVNTFTISTWIKPECDVAVSGMDFVRRLDISSFVLYPSSGEKLYGKGHKICGLIAGRNAAVVYERAGDDINPVLEVLAPMSGWTHITLVYENGAPSLYINGQLKGKGKPTGGIVHPSVGEEYQDVYALYFEGDMTAPQLANLALGAEKIKMLTAQKPNLSRAYPEVEMTGSKNDLLFWQNGNYTIEKSDGKKQPVNISGVAEPAELVGPWKVKFPPGLGAPAEITLPKLISLHTHPDAGVKYFSGTSSYHQAFNVKGNEISNNNRLYIDLGQVEVLAELILNGKNLGVLWKRPYRVDITDHVKTGENSLEIKVTNGWPNRLIGDEQLPEEYSYGVVNDGESGRIREMPEWFIKGEPRPASPRITFATWKHYGKDSPLLESGLIGPVTLRRGFSHTSK